MTNKSASQTQYQTHTLPCGLRIVHRRQDSPVSYCGFMMDCGTRDELTPSRYGMAHFIEHILFKGTTKRDSWHINNRMESVGGELNAFTTKEETTFYAAFLNHDYGRAIELLCDLVCHPTAPERELQKEQEVVVDEIMSYRDNPSELIFDEFENRLFAGHPLGHNILGSEATVRSFHSEDCLKFIRSHYTPLHSVFFFQGDVPLERVVKMVEKYYDPQGLQSIIGSQTTGSTLLTEEGSTHCTQEEGLTEGDTSEASEMDEACHHHQSHVILGATTFPLGHPDAAALALANNLLGGPGMNSRLNLALRERRGLVYSVESNLTTYTDTGCFSIYFGCDHADKNRCLRLCRQEIARLADTPLSPAQLAAAKRQLKGQLGVASANQENNAIVMTRHLLRLGHVESLDETALRIDAVTPVQICEVANSLFNNDLLITVAIE